MFVRTSCCFIFVLCMRVSGVLCVFVYNGVFGCWCVVSDVFVCMHIIDAVCVVVWGGGLCDVDF